MGGETTEAQAIGAGITAAAFGPRLDRGLASAIAVTPVGARIVFGVAAGHEAARQFEALAEDIAETIATRLQSVRLTRQIAQVALLERRTRKSARRRARTVRH